MVIRRIREHATSHNWFAVAIDILIVFIGVFLGIQANNWNEARLDEAGAKADRMRLLEDLRTNEVDLAGRIIYYKDVRRHALDALKGFASVDTALGEPFLVSAYQASQIRQRPVRSFTYEELVATGSLGRVGSQELRRQLDLYHLGLSAINANLRDVPPYRDRVRRMMPYSVQERIRSQCGERTHEMNGAVIRTLPSSCQTGVDGRLIASAVARLRAAPEMELDLTRYITDIDQRLDAYQLSQRLSRELRQELEQSAV